MAKGKKKMSSSHKGNLNPSRPSGKAWKKHPKKNKVRQSETRTSQ